MFAYVSVYGSCVHICGQSATILPCETLHFSSSDHTCAHTLIYLLKQHVHVHEYLGLKTTKRSSRQPHARQKSFVTSMSLKTRPTHSWANFQNSPRRAGEIVAVDVHGVSLRLFPLQSLLCSVDSTCHPSVLLCVSVCVFLQNVSGRSHSHQHGSKAECQDFAAPRSSPRDSRNSTTHGHVRAKRLL